MSLARTAFSLALLTALCTSVVSAADCKMNYEGILFPSGMPNGVGWDTKRQPEKFRCYAEAAISHDVSAVVFSEETITGSEDNLYKVKLAIIAMSANPPRELRSVDITQSIPVYVEVPGNFYGVNALV